MSTPVEQYVPPEFQQTIPTTTGPTLDPAAIAKAKLASQHASVLAAAKKGDVAALQSRLALAKSDWQKAQIKAQITAAQKAATAAAKNAATLQTKYYETSGQYDKLLTGENRDAFAALQTMFNQYGLGSLAGKIYQYVKQGYGADTVSLLLQDTKEYKQRFAANEARAKAGMAVLSPADYLATEDAYRQILSASGLPKGFYDNPADFTKWIANDVSPTEIKSRVDVATAETTTFDSFAKQQLAAFYGVDESHLVAYALDPTKAVSVIQKEAATAQFAAEAARRGLATDRARMESYISQGLSQSQAAQGFQIVAEELPNLQAIANRFGTTFGQAQEESAVFGTSAQATATRKRLVGQETALFAGQQGATVGGLGTGFQQT